MLLGLIKQVMARRPDLHVIVTSATLDTVRFQKHFDGCPVYAVPGRLFPVEVCFSLTDPKRSCKCLPKMGGGVGEVMGEGCMASPNH